MNMFDTLRVGLARLLLKHSNGRSRALEEESLFAGLARDP
jgi:hypothetical protein